MDLFGLLLYIVIGALAGWLAGQVMRGHSLGLGPSIVVGIIGSLVGGFAFRLIGLAATGLIGSLLVAFIGACLLLWIVSMLRRT